jgi:hypothetical protein
MGAAWAVQASVRRMVNKAKKINKNFRVILVASSNYEDEDDLR